jgi:hypothetical protein
MQQQGQITVRAAVLSDDESSRYFGVALADKGIQAVWLSVENGGDGTLYYLPATTDADYYTPPEASRVFKAWLSGEADEQRGWVFTREAMPDVVAPGQKASGFVLTHREGGLKFLRACFVGSGQQFDFRFVIMLGGRTFAAQKVDFSARPPNSENVDLASLRARLEKLPCCAANKAGDRLGDPLNLVVVGSGADAIFPFIERGWRLDEPLDIHSVLRTMSAFVLGTEYTTAPVSPLYVFGRTQDVALQKARNNISLRNHLRVWRAPCRHSASQRRKRPTSAPRLRQPRHPHQRVDPTCPIRRVKLDTFAPTRRTQALLEDAGGRHCGSSLMKSFQILLAMFS